MLMKQLVFNILLVFHEYVYLKEVQCTGDQFLSWNGTCQSHLLCNDMKLIDIREEMLAGYVKKLFLGVFDDMKVVYSYPRYEHVKEDFLHGINMLKAFQHSGWVVEMVGYCDDVEHLQLVTKYYKHGSADGLEELEILNSQDKFHTRLTLALDYLSILVFLHDSLLGTRVMCDSNDLQKTLSQFLITDDYHLVVVDLDALPEVNRMENITVKCGQKQLFGEFVAPEQLWPYHDRLFNDLDMPGYDEKVDIWKVPDVINFILGKSTVSTRVRLHMFDKFSRCKNIDPKLRPTALEIQKRLSSTTQKLNLKTEL